jgi:multicomponent Na+:H+ antiporter subunit E
MNLFLMNLFLAFGFAAVKGQLNTGGLVTGFVLGYAVLWLTRTLYGPTRYFQRVPKVLLLVGHFLADLVLSNFRVLWDVVTPSHISRPGIVGVPLDVESEMEILLLANLISLTPGTLSIDLAEDRSVLYIHVMFLDDPDRARREIKEGLERRILEVTR